jgi:hypothetical protein
LVVFPFYIALQKNYFMHDCGPYPCLIFFTPGRPTHRRDVA